MDHTHIPIEERLDVPPCQHCGGRARWLNAGIVELGPGAGTARTAAPTGWPGCACGRRGPLKEAECCMSLVGSDPGLTGAGAVLDANGTLGALADTPTLVLKGQRGRAPGL